MSARERILGKLRASTVPAAPATPDAGAWYAARQRGEGRAERIARFRSAMLAAHAEVHDTSSAGWPALLLDIARRKKVATLLVGDGGSDAEALESHAQSEVALLRYERPIEEWRDILFEAVDAGLTRARGAIAETGTLVLWPDAREPRAMSLVPPIHFVLLDAASIQADFHSALAGERWSERLPTNALLVSGPSKTADIQQTLAYGAHGPRELVVLLIDDEGEA